MGGAAASAALPDRATVQAANSGWKSLFNGRNLDDWHFFQEGETENRGVATVRDGLLRILGPDYRGAVPGVGLLTTRSRFENFHLKLEYRWGKRRFEPRLLQKRNSGLLYHLAETPRGLWPSCVEFQIQESDVADAILVNMQGQQGISIGGSPAWPEQPSWANSPAAVPSLANGTSRLWYRKDGNFERERDWNCLELIVQGDRAAHLVNGRIVNTLFGLRRLDGAAPGEGHIAIEIESAEIFIRQIGIRPVVSG